MSDNLGDRGPPDGGFASLNVRMALNQASGLLSQFLESQAGSAIDSEARTSLEAVGENIQIAIGGLVDLPDDKAKVQVFRGSRGLLKRTQWRAHVVAGNGRVLATLAEGYNNRSDLFDAIDRLFPHLQREGV